MEPSAYLPPVFMPARWKDLMSFHNILNGFFSIALSTHIHFVDGYIN